MFDSSETVKARCARCHRFFDAGAFAFDVAESLNAVLQARGEEPLSGTEIALCGGCEPAWQAERSDYAARYRQRWLEAWRRYKQAVRNEVEQGLTKRGAIDKVAGLLPTTLLHETEFRSMRAKWDAWYLEHGERKKGGDF